MALRLLGLINFSGISYNIASRLVVLVPMFALALERGRRLPSYRTHLYIVNVLNQNCINGQVPVSSYGSLVTFEGNNHE